MANDIKLGDYNVLRVKELARREGYGEVFGLYLDGIYWLFMALCLWV